MDRPEFVPIDVDALLTPADVDRYLRQIYNELYYARKDLRNARNEEIDALEVYSRARLPLLADPGCPDPNLSSVTVTQQRNWVNDRIPDQWWRYQRAKTARLTASDKVGQLHEQVKCLQSINSIAKQAFDLGGRV